MRGRHLSKKNGAIAVVQHDVQSGFFPSPLRKSALGDQDRTNETCVAYWSWTLCPRNQSKYFAIGTRSFILPTQTHASIFIPRLTCCTGETTHIRLWPAWLQGDKENSGGMRGTAAAAETLADVDGELHGHLKSNAELLGKVERELVAAESLAAHLLQFRAAE